MPPRMLDAERREPPRRLRQRRLPRLQLAMPAVEHERAGRARQVVADDVRVVVHHGAVGEHAVADLVGAAGRARAPVAQAQARVVAPVMRGRAGAFGGSLALDAVEEDLHARQHVRLDGAVAGGGIEHGGVQAQLVAHRAPLPAHVRVARAAANVRVGATRRDEEEHQRRGQRGPHGRHGIAAHRDHGCLGVTAA